MLKEYEEVNLKSMEPMDDEEMNASLSARASLPTDRTGERLGYRLQIGKGHGCTSVLNRMPIATLSGGERRSGTFAVCCFRSLMLLLDEPTNHWIPRVYSGSRRTSSNIRVLSSQLLTTDISG